MSNYSIEHIGFTVEKPIEMANWYKEVLGFKIRFSAEDDEKAVAFVTDCDEKVMLELGRVPDVKPLSKMMDHDLQLHIALRCRDPEMDMHTLIDHGAKFVERCPWTLPGDYLIVLSDPWGNSLQLVKRGHKI
jgi:catechol-2,3-dioxygenase